MRYLLSEERCNKAIPVSGHWDDIFFLGTNYSYISMFVQLVRDTCIFMM
ncbi:MULTISPECIES: hypothetical protein [Wolbachia]|nr:MULTISPECIES: hypothetical protein [Wolbachia]MBA8753460.1 hypothetical protein [Wolbachia pipientis]QTG99414.1 hypothetical protein J5252_03265 [Wolbachia pipientis]UID81634.1 hypothetical protein J4T77_02090 [Wolbachia endosymbiont of Drosophila innubila]WOE62412.1 hypothetical protein R0F62_04540 [Wolbachia endosymbiont of Drosophila aff. chauvacae BK-2020]WOE63917.1 hypothetical protein R0F63_06335 [Wolbachia endosymbiont of Zaprionus tsacasi]